MLHVHLHISMMRVVEGNRVIAIGKREKMWKTLISLLLFDSFSDSPE